MAEEVPICSSCGASLAGQAAVIRRDTLGRRLRLDLECAAVGRHPVQPRLFKEAHRATESRVDPKGRRAKIVRRRKRGAGVPGGSDPFNLNGAKGFVAKGRPRPKDATLHKKIGSTQNPRPGPLSQGGG